MLLIREGVGMILLVRGIHKHAFSRKKTNLFVPAFTSLVIYDQVKRVRSHCSQQPCFSGRKECRTERIIQ